VSGVGDDVDGDHPDRSRSDGLAHRIRSLAGLTLVSRILGVVREQIFARLFGIGLHADALVVAFRIPNLLRDLFAEGALSAAFVPALSRARADHGDEDAQALARAVLSTILLIVGALTVLGILFTPFLVDTIASGFSGGDQGDVKLAETIRLTRILFPVILMLSAAAVLRGVLNTYRRFTAPALAPPLSNAVAIAVGAGIWFRGGTTEAAATAWALALLGGGLVTIAVQLPSLRRAGISLRPTFKLSHPELRRMLPQMAIAAFALAAVQINIFVGTTLASRLAEGSVAALNYGFRLVYLPIGVIGVAIATVATVDVSARLAAGDRDLAARDLAGSLRLLAFLSLPSAVGLWVLAEPIVRLIFANGAFGEEGVALASTALRGYGIGLLFYSMTKVQVPACYALGAARIPLIASFISMTCFTAWAFLTYRSLGVFGLAVGTSIAALINAVVLAIGLRSRLPSDGSVWRSLLACTLLSGGMGLACHASADFLERAWGWEGTAAQAGTVGVTVLVGVAIVLGGGRLLGLPEAGEVLGALGLRRRP
jgi:putative peptidoglycan lipid II flippase